MNESFCCSASFGGVGFCTLAIQEDVYCYLIVFICTALMTYEMEHLFTFSLSFSHLDFGFQEVFNSDFPETEPLCGCGPLESGVLGSRLV